MKCSMHRKDLPCIGVSGPHLLCWPSSYAGGVSNDWQVLGVDTQFFAFASQLTSQDSPCWYLAVAAFVVASSWPFIAYGIQGFT